MRRLPYIALLLVATPAFAEESSRARDLVRAALLDGATAPDAAEMPVAKPAHDVERRAAPPKRIDVEHEAHLRAAEHGTRHSGDAHPGARGDASGGTMHGGPGAMDGGADCHDAASNMRTRGMHDGGGMGPGHMGP